MEKEITLKVKIIFLLIFLALFSVNIFAQTESSTDFVKSFYNFHRSRSGVFNAKELNLLKKWFTPQLNKLVQSKLKREDEFIKQNPDQKPHWGDGFSFYPLEECYKNNKEIKNILKIGKTSVNGNKTFVEVSFFYPTACEGGLIHSYKFELVRTKNNWLINDFIFLVDNSRLTDDLKREKY